MTEVTISRPDFDLTTEYGAYWKEKIVRYAVDKGFIVNDLYKENATYDYFYPYVLSSNFVLGVGHGSSSKFTGHELDTLLEVGAPDTMRMARRRHFHLLSCSIGKALAPVCVDVYGAEAFHAYNNVYTFVVNPDLPKEEDPYSRPFFISDNQIDKTLLDKQTHFKAFVEGQRKYRYFIESPDTPDPLKPYLLDDSAGYFLFGKREVNVDGETVPGPESSTIHIKVVDNHGLPINRVLVVAAPFSRWTNRRGEATLEVVSGIYDLKFFKGCYTDVSKRVDATESIRVEAQLSPELRKCIQFWGYVYEGSRPARGARAFLYTNGLCRDTSFVKEDGFYHLKGLNKDGILLVMVGPNWIYYSGQGSMPDGVHRIDVNMGWGFVVFVTDSYSNSSIPNAKLEFHGESEWGEEDKYYTTYTDQYGVGFQAAANLFYRYDLKVTHPDYKKLEMDVGSPFFAPPVYASLDPIVIPSEGKAIFKGREIEVPNKPNWRRMSKPSRDIDLIWGVLKNIHRNDRCWLKLKDKDTGEIIGKWRGDLSHNKTHPFVFRGKMPLKNWRLKLDSGHEE